MTSIFTPMADAAPYQKLTPKIALDQMNPPLTALSGRRLLAARQSAAMKWTEPDDAPEKVLNQILYRCNPAARITAQWKKIFAIASRDAGSKLVESRFRSTVRALRHRNFRLFFAGQLVSLIGTWMQTVAQSWLVYRLTGSSALLGSVNFARQIPVFLLSPIGGVVPTATAGIASSSLPRLRPCCWRSCWPG